MVSQVLVPARRAALVELVFALLVLLLLGAPTLAYPFGRDQGEYAYIATAALGGKAVYRDVISSKPPMTHIVHELALLAFGRTMLAIRILDLLWQGATALVIALVANRATGRRGVGLLAALLYALSYYSYTYWHTAQTDGFLNLPAALAVLAFLLAQERASARLHLACGVALGIAFLFKYPIAMLLPLLAVILLLHRGKDGLRWALFMGLGFCLPVAVCVASLAAQGALDDFLFVQATFLPVYTGQQAGIRGYVGSVLRLVTQPNWYNRSLWVSAVAIPLGALHAWRKRSLPRVLPVFLWWLAALVSYVAQNKGFPYHTLSLLAPQAIIIAQAAGAVVDRASTPLPLRVALAALVAAGLYVPLAEYSQGTYRFYRGGFASLVSGRRPLEALYEAPAFGRYGEGDFSMKADLEVARYIEAHSAPEDAVFIYGVEATIYFLSHRRCASRYIAGFHYTSPLLQTPAWQHAPAEFLAELGRNAPLYILVASNDAIPWATGTPDDSRASAARFAGFSELLARGYHEEKVIEHFTLYRRN